MTTISLVKLLKYFDGEIAHFTLTSFHRWLHAWQHWNQLPWHVAQILRCILCFHPKKIKILLVAPNTYRGAVSDHNICILYLTLTLSVQHSLCGWIFIDGHLWIGPKTLSHCHFHHIFKHCCSHTVGLGLIYSKQRVSGFEGKYMN